MIKNSSAVPLTVAQVAAAVSSVVPEWVQEIRVQELEVGWPTHRTLIEIDLRYESIHEVVRWLREDLSLTERYNAVTVESATNDVVVALQQRRQSMLDKPKGGVNL